VERTVEDVRESERERERESEGVPYIHSQWLGSARVCGLFGRDKVS